jgi:hypothetical protein
MKMRSGLWVRRVWRSTEIESEHASASRSTHRLPPGSALVSYAAAGEGRDRSYVVFVLTGQQPQITFHRIGQATRVESIVSRWLSTVGGAARELRHLHAIGVERGAIPWRHFLWMPIASSIGDAMRCSSWVTARFSL